MAGVTVRALDPAGAMCVGCFHPAEPVAYPAGAWTAAELEALRADPALEVVDGYEPPAAGAPQLDPDALDALRAMDNDRFAEVLTDVMRIAEKRGWAGAAPTGSLTQGQLKRLAELDRDWIDRLIAVANLRAEQVDRLVDLESDGVQALLSPPAPTVEATLAAALEALRQATPDRVREFFRTIVEDPEIAATLEPEPTRQETLIAGIAGLDPKNPDHWLSDGTTPSTKALEAATGIDDISAAERDSAHAEFVKREGAGLTGG